VVKRAQVVGALVKLDGALYKVPVTKQAAPT